MQGSGGLLRGVDTLDEPQQTAVPPLGGRGPGGDGVPGALGEPEPGGVAARPGLWVEAPLPKCPASPSSLLTSQQPTPWAEGSWRGPPGCREGQRVELRGCWGARKGTSLHEEVAVPSA